VIIDIHGLRHAILSEGANKLKLFLKNVRRKKFWVLEPFKTVDWRSKIGDKKFFRSGFSSFFWKLYKNRMECFISLSDNVYSTKKMKTH